MVSRKRRSVVMGALALVAAALIGWFGHAVFGVKSVRIARVSAPDPFVAVAEVQLEKFNPPEEFVGHVEPVQEVDILPQIEGYIREVKFAEGDSVAAGDLLFEIDDERYAAEAGVAQATLAQAKAKVSEAEAAVDRSERYLKRLEAADQRGITQTEKDAAETGLAADRAALASARAAVSQAEAALASTAFNVKHTKIYAPISGRIGKTLMHAGDYVSPSKGALARIVQTDPVRVCFPITDRAYLAWCANATSRGAVLGMTRRLRLRLADGSIYPSCGTWEFSDNEMSVETATLIVRAQFANAGHALVPNAYVTVLADEADPQPTPVIPAMAVAKSGSVSGVWMVADDQTVHFRPIVIRARLADKVQVAEGVTPGDRIVVQGVHKLGEGLSVRIVPASHFQ